MISTLKYLLLFIPSLVLAETAFCVQTTTFYSAQHDSVCDPEAQFCFSNAATFVIFTNLSTAGDSAVFNWDFGDGTTSTQKSPNHQYMAPGEYPVSLTVTDTCNSHTYEDSIFVSTGFFSGCAVGIADRAQLQSITIFPNPTHQNVMVTYDANKTNDLSFCLFDLLGQKVPVLFSSVAGKLVLNISNLKPGQYFLQLSDRQYLSTHKIIKQ